MRKLENSELDRLSVDGFKAVTKTPLIVILDNIRSLNNIGSVFRTSDAFRIEKIYLCGITATPPHKDIQKTALGSTESVNWDYAESTLELVKKLQSKDIQVLSIEQAENATMLHKFTPKTNHNVCPWFLAMRSKGFHKKWSVLAIKLLKSLSMAPSTL